MRGEEEREWGKDKGDGEERGREMGKKGRGNGERGSGGGG